MKDHAPRDDRITLAWLDDALEWARLRNRIKLVKLLNHVQAEVLLDVVFAESLRPTRGRATVDGPTFDTNRGA